YPPYVSRSYAYVPALLRFSVCLVHFGYLHIRSCTLVYQRVRSIASVHARVKRIHTYIILWLRRYSPTTSCVVTALISTAHNPLLNVQTCASVLNRVRFPNDLSAGWGDRCVHIYSSSVRRAFCTRGATLAASTYVFV